MTAVAKETILPAADTASEDVPEECVICMDNIGKRGQIDCCDHKFCFECIVKWSKVTNKCPVCKRDFKKVSEVGDTVPVKGKRKRKGKVVNVKPRVQRITYNPPPLNPARIGNALDISGLMRMLLGPAMFAGIMQDGYDSGEDSDYHPDLDEARHRVMNRPQRRRLVSPPPPPRPRVQTNDIIENGQQVIEILDDDDDEEERIGASRHAPMQRRTAADRAPQRMSRRTAHVGSPNVPRRPNVLHPFIRTGARRPVSNVRPPVRRDEVEVICLDSDTDENVESTFLGISATATEEDASSERRPVKRARVARDARVAVANDIREGVEAVMGLSRGVSSSSSSSGSSGSSSYSAVAVAAPVADVPMVSEMRSELGSELGSEFDGFDAFLDTRVDDTKSSPLFACEENESDDEWMTEFIRSSEQTEGCRRGESDSSRGELLHGEDVRCFSSSRAKKTAKEGSVRRATDTRR